MGSKKYAKSSQSHLERKLWKAPVPAAAEEEPESANANHGW